MIKNKIDILFVTHRHEVAGGAEKALLEMLEYLSKNKINCHVISGAEGSFTEALDKLGIKYTIVGQPYWAHGPEDDSPFVYSGTNPKINPVAQSVDLIRQLQPRLCVSNTIVIPWLAYASAITNTHHAWMIHENGTDGLKLQYGIGEEQTMKTVDVFSDAIFFNSKWTKNSYKNNIIICKNTFITYPGGTSLSVDVNQKNNPYDSKCFNVSIVGQIKPQKGQMDAVRAIKLLTKKTQKVRLHLIGGTEDSSYHKKIMKYIKDNNLSKFIKLIGQVENPYNYVNNSDAVIVCAQNEAFGRVTIEAMLLKIPVVGAASAGTLELIEDQKTGFLYPPGDIKALYTILDKVMTDKRLSEWVARAGHDFASITFREDIRFSSFINYFRKISQHPSSLTLSPLYQLVENYELVIHELNQKSNSKHRLLEIFYRDLSKIRRIIKKLLFV